MHGSRLKAAFATVAAVCALGILIYYSVLRPRFLTWGATDEDTKRPLPGDELIPDPVGQVTRAITINAPTADIWPWLVQIGQDRGGFYSYDWLENLFGLNIHSAVGIVPEWQDLAIGDMVKFHPDGGNIVALLKPARALVLYADPETMAHRSVSLPTTLSKDYLAFMSTWGFYLEPLDEQTTRLIVRSRGTWRRNIGSVLMWSVLMEPAHFIMERKMLLSIRERAETIRSHTENVRT